jgi:hypothetical protein
VSRALPRPTVYLDGSAIRGVISEDMRPRDRVALCRIAAMVSDDLLTFFAPASARAEIDRIAVAARRQHPREFAALEILRAAAAGWLDVEPPAPAGSGYAALLALVGNGADAASLARARLEGVRDLIAAEPSVLLERARELAAQFELRVFRPADYLSRWSTQLQLPK